MDRQTERLQIKFEENPWRALAVLQHASVVRDAVLVCTKRLGTRGDVCCWNYMDEVLVRDE